MTSIDQKINERFLQKTPLTDKSLVKAKDLGLLKQVTDYLDSKELQYEIRGSAQENASKGRPRNYADLDIVVRKDENGKSYDAALTLSRVAAQIEGFEDTFPTFSKYIKLESLLHQMYARLWIDKRFKIEDPKTSTKIDLNFEGTKPTIPRFIYNDFLLNVPY